MLESGTRQKESEHERETEKEKTLFNLYITLYLSHMSESTLKVCYETHGTLKRLNEVNCSVSVNCLSSFYSNYISLLR